MKILSETNEVNDNLLLHYSRLPMCMLDRMYTIEFENKYKQKYIVGSFLYIRFTTYSHDQNSCQTLRICNQGTTNYLNIVSKLHLRHYFCPRLYRDSVLLRAGLLKLCEARYIFINTYKHIHRKEGILSV